MDCLQKNPMLELTAEELIIEDVPKLEHHKLEPSSDCEEVCVQNEPIMSDSGDEEIAENDTSATDLYCGKCDKHFVNPGNFHFSTHTKDKPTFCCKFCRKEFTSNTQFELHEKECEIISEVEILPDGDIFICPRCFRTFNVKELCIRHVHSHNTRQKCIERKRLEKTQDSVPSEILKCSECPKKYKNQVTLSRHMQMHIDLRVGTYKCKTCGQHFRMNNELINHSLVAHGKFQMAVPAEPTTGKLKIPARASIFSKPKKGTFRSKARTNSQRREWKKE